MAMVAEREIILPDMSDISDLGSLAGYDHVDADENTIDDAEVLARHAKHLPDICR